MRLQHVASATVLALMLMVDASQAKTVIKDFEFVAVFNEGPSPAITGSYTVSYDTGSMLTTLSNLDVRFPSQFSKTVYYSTGPAGASAGNSEGFPFKEPFETKTNEYVFDLQFTGGAPYGEELAYYVSPSQQNAYFSSGVLSYVLQPVPLPSSSPLFAAALLGLVSFSYSLNRWVAPKSKKAAAN